jgi:hypothetical protein
MYLPVWSQACCTLAAQRPAACAAADPASAAWLAVTEKQGVKAAKLWLPGVVPLLLVMNLSPLN